MKNNTLFLQFFCPRLFLLVFLFLAMNCVAAPPSNPSPKNRPTVGNSARSERDPGPMAVKNPIDLRNLLRQGRLPELEGLYDYLNSEPRPRTAEGQLLLITMYRSLLAKGDMFPGFSMYCQRVIPIVEKWVADRPNSHLAKALLGVFRLNQAWDARGGGWASTVPPAGWAEFKKRLEEARTILERAWELDPSDPYPPAQLVTVAMGLQDDLSEIDRQVDRALKADSRDISALEGKLYYLEPKWHGSIRQLLDFGRECAKSGVAISPAPYLLLEAHKTCANYSRDLAYFKRPGVWEELKPALETLVQRFPRSPLFRNEYARMAFLAGDFGTAYQEVQRLGPEWFDYSMWQSLGDFKRVRDAARTQAGLGIGEQSTDSHPENSGYATDTFILPVRFFPETMGDAGTSH